MLPMAGLDPWAFSPRASSVGTHVSLAAASVDSLQGVVGGTSPAKENLVKASAYAWRSASRFEAAAFRGTALQ